MTSRILSELVIDKIAAVDRPCQEHATVTIMKRKFTDDERKAMAGKEAMADGSFPIKSAKDVSNAVNDWGRAGSKPSVKAHIISRAKAIGAEDHIPDDWVKKMAPDDLAKFIDRLAKDMYGSVQSAVPPPSTTVAEDFDQALSEVVSQNLEWKLESAIYSDLSPMIDALRKSLCSIFKDQTLGQNDRLLAVRSSIGQFMTAVQGMYADIQIAKQIDAVITKRADIRQTAAKITKLRLDVLKVKTNEMLQIQEGKGGGKMPKTRKLSRNSQPMEKGGLLLEGFSGSKKKPKSHKNVAGAA